MYYTINYQRNSKEVENSGQVRYNFTRTTRAVAEKNSLDALVSLQEGTKLIELTESWGTTTPLGIIIIIINAGRFLQNKFNYRINDFIIC